MKKILINFAEGKFYRSQKLNSQTGLEIGGFDEVRSYSFSDIDESFKRKNWHILREKRGAGYWLWKSYFILKTLNECSVGDVVFYCDSGCLFLDSVSPLVDIVRENDIVPFYIVNPDGPGHGSLQNPLGEVLWERQQTKRDVFYFLNCDDMKNDMVRKVHESRPRCGSPQLYRKSDYTMQFINQYLRYCEDYRLITNAPNACGLPDYSENIAYRNDQSIFSVLTKMLDIKAYQDPAMLPWSQLPDNGKLYYNEMASESLYGRIINLHRNPS